ncbi:hypothetical protein JZ751_028941 [Albula glossodonta]|uniref:Peptidase M24 domain-containing protein n=1 Tax=Albula glossodonta TaxID=121402 RepID=A0A8T2MWJ1_9TELE|nr:hypothetical protein JZ751_028941 [Albula glossodonta]
MVREGETCGTVPLTVEMVREGETCGTVPLTVEVTQSEGFSVCWRDGRAQRVSTPRDKDGSSDSYSANEAQRVCDQESLGSGFLGSQGPAWGGGEQRECSGVRGIGVRGGWGTLGVGLRQNCGCSVLLQRGALSQCQQLRSFFWRKWQKTHSVVRPATVQPAYSVPKHIKRPDYVTTGVVPAWGDYIEIKDEDQIQGLRRACQLARHILLLAGKSLKVGMTTEEIDFIVHQETIRHNAYPSPLNYGGFPKSVCTSVNNVVYLEGFHGDTSETFLMGEVDEHGRRLVEAAQRCRDEAIAACRPEPILMEGSPEFAILKDRWTAISIDDKRSAQFEHTVVITSDGVEILTKLPDED